MEPMLDKLNDPNYLQKIIITKLEYFNINLLNNSKYYWNKIME